MIKITVDPAAKAKLAALWSRTKAATSEYLERSRDSAHTYVPTTLTLRRYADRVRAKVHAATAPKE